MSNQRTHQATTTDGVTIAGTVHGQGPPLVFSPGGIGDGGLDWQALVGHLTGRFTCYLPSLRGRGLSGDRAPGRPPAGGRFVRRPCDHRGVQRLHAGAPRRRGVDGSLTGARSDGSAVVIVAPVAQRPEADLDGRRQQGVRAPGEAG